MEFDIFCSTVPAVTCTAATPITLRQLLRLSHWQILINLILPLLLSSLFSLLSTPLSSPFSSLSSIMTLLYGRFVHHTAWAAEEGQRTHGWHGRYALYILLHDSSWYDCTSLLTVPYDTKAMSARISMHLISYYYHVLIFSFLPHSALLWPLLLHRWVTPPDSPAPDTLNYVPI